MLILGIGALVVLYSIYYLSKEKEALIILCLSLVIMGAMLGVVFRKYNCPICFGNPRSSFLLIAYWYQRKGSRYGARRFTNHFLVVCMLAGFLSRQNNWHPSYYEIIYR